MFSLALLLYKYTNYKNLYVIKLSSIAWYGSDVKLYLKVGFNAGDGIVSFTVNASRSPDIINVNEDSNVEIPGKFVFRIDASDITDGGCNTEGIFQ